MRLEIEVNVAMVTVISILHCAHQSLYLRHLLDDSLLTDISCTFLRLCDRSGKAKLINHYTSTFPIAASCVPFRTRRPVNRLSTFASSSSFPSRNRWMCARSFTMPRQVSFSNHKLTDRSLFVCPFFCLQILSFLIGSVLT